MHEIFPSSMLTSSTVNICEEQEDQQSMATADTAQTFCDVP